MMKVLPLTSTPSAAKPNAPSFIVLETQQPLDQRHSLSPQILFKVRSGPGAFFLTLTRSTA